MAASVKAHSLSDIIHLASNPPRFPRNPSQAPRESLTLYISRVPGSRDIILTTLKPLMINVTSQDVDNSLYYFRACSEKDSHVSKENLADQLSKQHPKNIMRKPLKISSTSPEVLNGSADPNILPLSQRNFSIKRKPVGGSDSQIPTNPHRQPLESRNQSSSSSPARKPLLISENHFNVYSSENSPTSLFPQYHDTSPKNPLSDVESCKNSQNTFSVEVIRRNPSTGAQWNVGAISGHSLIEKAHGGRTLFLLAKKPEFDISISLTTPGYLCFRHLKPPLKILDNPSSDPFSQLPQESSHSFKRNLLMEGSSLWSRVSAQRRRAMSDLSDKQNDLDRPRFNEKNNQEKGYVFLSPWGGRCKFLTESGGRSLRCRHTLPSSVSVGPFDAQQRTEIVSELRFNLPSLAMKYSLASCGTNAKLEKFPDFKHSHHSKKNNCLKLRPPDFSNRPSSPLFHSRSSAYEQRLYRSQSSVVSSDQMEGYQAETRENTRELSEIKSNITQGDIHPKNFDLAIGREKAGGGYKGKHAKLGKLIIHDEGLKMLDLVVSANMAIWWSVWES